MNIIFLDFNGVLNTPLVNKEEICESLKINISYDSINNRYAVDFLSYFCEKHNYDIVVTSSTRFMGLDKCKQMLYDAGLSKNVDVVGITGKDTNGRRDCEVRKYLQDHKEIDNFLILDDDGGFRPDLMKHLVYCTFQNGLTYSIFMQMEKLIDII